MSQPFLMRGAEPFMFPGGPIGCLLVHGFTGASNEMRWMGEYLAGEGFTVLGIRLAGHGTRPDDLTRVRWRDWLASIEDGLALLRGLADTVFMAGLSMGGVLTLLSASRYPLAGAVAMSTPYDLPRDWRLNFIRPLSRVMPRVQKGDAAWRSTDAAATHVEYPYYPTIAIAEMRDLLVELRAALPLVKIPVLLAHSREDQVVDPAHMQLIYDRLGTGDKEMFWVNNSSHVITREPEREQVFARAADFIRRVAASEQERTSQPRQHPERPHLE